MTIDILDTKIQKHIDDQIKYIRHMAMLTDEQIKETLLKVIMEHPHLIEKHEQEKEHKLFNEMNKIAKDVKSSPLKFARKVDGGINL